MNSLIFVLVTHKDYHSSSDSLSCNLLCDILGEPAENQQLMRCFKYLRFKFKFSFLFRSFSVKRVGPVRWQPFSVSSIRLTKPLGPKAAVQMFFKVEEHLFYRTSSGDCFCRSKTYIFHLIYLSKERMN